MKTRILLLISLSALTLTGQSSSDHWVATWTTAQNLVRTPPPAPPPAAATNANSPAPPRAGGPPRSFSNQTVRQIVRTSIPGRHIRIRLSNNFAGQRVMIGAAHIALREKDSEIKPATDHALTFNGKPGCTLGPGQVLVSDPVDLDLPPLSDVAVSLFFPEETGAPTTHGTALHTTYIKEGDLTAEASLADATTTQSYYYLAGLEVMAPSSAALVVTFGDSITDGARSTSETNHSWPALLAARLAAKKDTAQIAVANMGIGGNRVLRDGAGASALARFDRDVLSQAGVRWVMLLEGINDIGVGARDSSQTVAADDLIAGYKQLIDRAHTAGIKIIGCTLTPFEGAGYQNENGEAVRTAVNTWIRTSKAFDAVVDFEAVTRDTANPKRFRADFDPGDHLHPNNAGYEAMAEAIDLSIFKKK